MIRLKAFKCALIGGASVLVLSHQSVARDFDVPRGDLASALDIFTQQAGVQIIYSGDAVRGHQSKGVKGEYSELAALSRVLSGTGFTTRALPSSAVGVVPQDPAPTRVAQATVPGSHPRPSGAIETVVVTAQRKVEDIQTVPIAVTAMSQKQLTERQIAGGPDLIKEVPNLTFSKTNFTGYNLQIRGIGTQAISVTTDPAVAVAFNGIPFIRNHFFEQEFYDVNSVEILRGPQGTLWGRNATAGVVNVMSAKPTDQFEVVGSVDFGNYNNRRLEGMINIPLVDDKLDLRLAGEWTKRDGYSTNALTNQSIDGRDLWSGRASLLWRPTSELEVNLVWEHFSEDDDRMRTAKQLCQTDVAPTSVLGIPVEAGNLDRDGAFRLGADHLSQGCTASSLYSPSSFQVPYGFSLPYAVALGAAGLANPNLDPYASTTQSTNLRVIESALEPHYRAKNDTIELNAEYQLTPMLTVSSQTGYNQDYLRSTEDYNRFNTSPGIFLILGQPNPAFLPDPAAGTGNIPANAATFCDPQLGCSDRLVAEDLSEEHAWQLSQEFRLASSFDGPLNFSAGGNYLHYETEENYYVFINGLSAFSGWEGSNNTGCLQGFIGLQGKVAGFQNPNPIVGGGEPTQNCVYVDPNPITSLNNYGHNYFLSQNPYLLNSYAVFGEAYYQIASDLKFTGGLRWTNDQKHFTPIPSEATTQGYGYWRNAPVDQQWSEITGRSALNWTPKLDFTDQTLVYASYSRGYKAGGANPPGAVFGQVNGGGGDVAEPIHPLTFRPEFINAYELGTKNTLFDGALTLNADVFYYAYQDYQISEIVDRTSINLNFNARVKGAEIESTWEPTPGLKFSFAGGYENGRLNNGDSAVDLIDRTAGTPGWMVVKPFPTQASNCVLPTYVVAALLEETGAGPGQRGNSGDGTGSACTEAYVLHVDPVTLNPYIANPSGTSGSGAGIFNIPPGYVGFDPASAPNNGEGFSKNLAGNMLPNAPPFTVSFTTDYTIPVTQNWAATLHGDFYWQADSFARVFNDKPYDQIHGYYDLNLALILNSADGWQVMGYVKNVFNTTAITGDFLNSDDSGLTTNVFLTDPRLFGIRITKDMSAGEPGSYGVPEFVQNIFTVEDKPSLWIELGGQIEQMSGEGQPFAPLFLAANPSSSVLLGPTPVRAQNQPRSFGEEASISFQPEDSDWIVSASVRIGRANNFKHVDHQTHAVHQLYANTNNPTGILATERFSDTQVHNNESHSILDFMAGKDVGLGMFGLDGSSTLSAGVRFAQFSSKESMDIRARPDINVKYYPSAQAPGRLFLPAFTTYHATGQATRSFRGQGPSISWNGSLPVTGDLQAGEATFDWGANAAVLFGRQKTRVRHMESAHYQGHYGFFQNTPYTLVYQRSGEGHVTDRSLVVPNVGGFAGISYRLKNAKFSLGYRADFFFGAIDGGIDKPKSETLGFFGPFAKISIGLGG